jgi:hypothetical protein
VSAPDPAETAELTEALRLARRAVKLSHDRQESAEETLQRVRRERAGLREQTRLFADALARLLSERYWASQSGGGPAARLRRGRGDATERDRVAAVEASDLFDGGWYLRHQPDAVRELMSPALHYVRTAAERKADPGPRFDTSKYLKDHPEVRDSDLPALLHHLGHGRPARG